SHAEDRYVPPCCSLPRNFRCQTLPRLVCPVSPWPFSSVPVRTRTGSTEYLSSRRPPAKELYRESRNLQGRERVHPHDPVVILSPNSLIWNSFSVGGPNPANLF